MAVLALCILFSALVGLLFKLIGKFKIPASEAILFNYLTCVALGYFLLPDVQNNISLSNNFPAWIWVACLVGGLYIITFYLIAASTQQHGITRTITAQKVSLILPVTASLLWWNNKEHIGPLLVIGLLLAFVAVVLTTRQNSKTQAPTEIKNSKWYWILNWLPVLVFACAGLADTLLNYSSVKLINHSTQGMFTYTVFVVAALTALLQSVLIGFQKGFKRLHYRAIVAGIFLGLPNLFSLLYLLKSLAAFKGLGALVYPIVNISVIILSTLLGVLFKERPNRLNWLGLAFSLLSLGILIYYYFNLPH